MDTNDNPIQIVAFSTNDTYQTPNDFINIFLSSQQHTVLKRSKHSIAFSLSVQNIANPVKVMICTILNLTRTYSGISDVNCYMLFVSLDEEESKEKLDSILSYMQSNCDENKKLFVFAISKTQNEEMHIGIKQDEIKEKLESLGKKYEMKLIVSSENAEEISNYFVEILLYSNKNIRKVKDSSDNNNNNDDEFKNDGASGSCVII